MLRGCPVGRLTGDPDVIASDALREPVRETFAVFHECLARAVAEGAAADEFEAGLDPEQTASTLAAVIQGGYALARAEGSAEPFDRAVRGVLALLQVSSPTRR